MASNKGLREAKAGKNDEFYTQLTDIERILGARLYYVIVMIPELVTSSNTLPSNFILLD